MAVAFDRRDEQCAPQDDDEVVGERLGVVAPHRLGIHLPFECYADDILEEHGVIERVRRFVRKPFTPRELTRVIRDVLD